MPSRDDFAWFKRTFGERIGVAVRGTPFTLDMLAAIAAQETGHIWASLRDKLSLPELLQICVGDTLDADKGRRAFPQTKDALIAVPRGEEMFRIAHEALMRMAAQIPSFAAVAKRPNKFCHGFGLFQYDLQFFKTDPDYFLERRWRDFEATLGKCLEELRNAARRIGLDSSVTLTDLERVHVAIAYNAGTFKPAKGLKQGHFDGKQFYGEKILDFLRMSQSAESPPEPGTAAIAPPTPAAATGVTLEVDVEIAPLRLRSEPRKDLAKPSANVIAHLPDGHRVRLISGKKGDEFFEVETNLNGAFLHGFAASEFLKRIKPDLKIPLGAPEAVPAGGGIPEAHAPNKSGIAVKRTAHATALSLNEPGQPGRTGTTPEDLRKELITLIDYLAVDKASHARYQPREGRTFCNIYAHDFCHLAGVYLPRVWWRDDALVAIARGQTVEPRVGSTLVEQRANDLFRWLQAFGPQFGWRQTGTLTKLQTEVNLGAVAVIVARRNEDGKSGHITIVAPEVGDNKARRGSAGEVIAPLQSQAGARNFRLSTGPLNWWRGEQFADSAFWIHA
jgi:hypothetical protein